MFSLHALASPLCCSWVCETSCSSSSSTIGDDDDADSPSIGNSSDRHSLRRKLWSATHANTISTCVLNGNGGADLKMVNRDLKMPNILSITFLNDAWRRLNNSFSFSGSFPLPAKSWR